jgi:hypothetical protein
VVGRRAVSTFVNQLIYSLHEWALDFGVTGSQIVLYNARKFERSSN